MNFRDGSDLTIRDVKASAIDDPFEQSLFLLVHIAYLQAFSDVNKRTSRLSANIPLCRHNLVPLSFKSIARDDYASAMIAVYELNDIGPIADLYLASYFRSCEEYDATVEALGFDEVRVRYRQQRRRVVGHIITKPADGGSAVGVFGRGGGDRRAGHRPGPFPRYDSGRLGSDFAATVGRARRHPPATGSMACAGDIAR